MTPYHHNDNEFFRLGYCENCRLETFHKPVEHKLSSGKKVTSWLCEYCKFESGILIPVENELEKFSLYVKTRYLKKEENAKNRRSKTLLNLASEYLTSDKHKPTK